MITIKAFKLRDDDNFYDAISGLIIENFEGYCLVYCNDPPAMIFKTGLNEDQDRYWTAIGNNPKEMFTL